MLNKVILIGNLGADAETLNFENGSLTKASLATSENYKDKNGEWQSKTEWHNLIFPERLAERAALLKKGQRIYAEGKIETKKYTDKQGVEKRAINIRTFLFRKLDKDEGANEQNSNASAPKAQSTDNDDLPF